MCGGIDLELETVKVFLKVDFDDDDEYISLLIDVATEYIISAVGYCDYSIARMRLLALVLIMEMYEKREFTTESLSQQNLSQKARYTVRSIISQLQIEGDKHDRCKKIH